MPNDNTYRESIISRMSYVIVVSLYFSLVSYLPMIYGNGLHPNSKYIHRKPRDVIRGAFGGCQTLYSKCVVGTVLIVSVLIHLLKSSSDFVRLAFSFFRLLLYLSFFRHSFFFPFFLSFFLHLPIILLLLFFFFFLPFQNSS